MLDPFAQPFQHCWGHARALHMVSKVLWAVSFPWCTAGPNIVGSCCIHLHYVGSCCICLHLAEHTTLSNTCLAFCPEHSKTSKWVLKLQFLTLRQDHKDPFTFMSETHLNPPSPNPRLLNPRFLQMEGSKEKQSSGPGCSNMPESPIQWINH